jgi:hypothetical protein
MFVSLREHTAPLVRAFTRYVDRPVVDGLAIDPGGLQLSGQHPAALGDLFASHAAVVVGEYRGSSTKPPRLRGSVEGRRIEIPVTVVRSAEKDEVLAALWARAAVADLEPALWSGPDPEAKKAITRLGLEHHIVTAFTSRVAVDESHVVGSGDPRRVVEPTLAPEGVDPAMAGAPMYGANAGGITTIGHTSAEMDYRVDGVRAVGRVRHSVVQRFHHRPEGIGGSWEPRARLLIGGADAPRGTRTRPFKRVIRGIRHRLRYCYEKSPAFDRSKHYALTLELAMRRGSLVLHLRTRGLHDDVRACMERLLEDQRWPKLTGRVTIVLTLSGA